MKLPYMKLVLVVLLGAAAASGQTPQYLPANGAAFSGTGANKVLAFPYATRSDEQRNGIGWLDARTKGIVCGTGIDNTTPMQTMLLTPNKTDIELPACNDTTGYLYVNAGPSSGTPNLVIPSNQSWVNLHGRGRKFQTVISDLGLNLSSAPILKVGDPNNFLENIFIHDLALFGAGRSSMTILSAGTGCTSSVSALATTASGTGTGMKMGMNASGGVATLGYVVSTGDGNYTDGETIFPVQSGCTASFTLHLVGSLLTAYPNGLLNFESFNLGGVDNIHIQSFGSGQGTTLLKNTIGGGPFSFFAEVFVRNSTFFCSQADAKGIGMDIQSPTANFNVTDSSTEACQTGIRFRGIDGSPVLTVTGGHAERIGIGGGNNVGDAFYIDQAQPFLRGVDAQSGNIYLGCSTFGGDIMLGSTAKGYDSFFSDCGVGNRYHRAGAFGPNAQPTDMTGSEWYMVPNNAVTDPAFVTQGTTGWTTSGPAFFSNNSLASPGISVGRSLQMSPILTVTNGGTGCTTNNSLTTTSNGSGTGTLIGITASGGVVTSAVIGFLGTGYNNGDLVFPVQTGCTAVFTITGGYFEKTYKVSPNTDYLFTGSFFFTPTQQAALVRVYDQNGTLVWDSTTFSGNVATPGLLGQSAAWRVVHQLLPNTGSSVTSYKVRIYEPGSTGGPAGPLQPVQVAWLGLYPSLTTLQAPTLTGSAVASGTGLTYQVAIAGSGAGSINKAVWTINGPSYQSEAWVYLNIQTATDSAFPSCFVGTTGSSTASFVMALIPGTQRIYRVPVLKNSGTITCQDFFGPTGDPNDIVVTQVGVFPIYTPPSPVEPVYMSSPNTTFTGTGSDQTLASMTLGPYPAGHGVDGWFSINRQTGTQTTGTQNVKLTANGGSTVLLNCTWANATVQLASPFRFALTNAESGTSTQDLMVSSPSTVTQGCIGFNKSGYVDWSVAQTFTLTWNSYALTVGSAGAGCTTANNLATTTTGAGTGAVINIVATAGALTSATLSTLGTGYVAGDHIIPTQGGCTGYFLVATGDATQFSFIDVRPR